MIFKPMIRNNICMNAHPLGCAKEVERQINYIKERAKKNPIANMPKCVLVLGCSGGYGIATRIVSAFGGGEGKGAVTVGLSFEREPSETKSGTPGWYFNRAFDKFASEAGIKFVNFEGDAFQLDTKKKIAQAARDLGLQYDLVVYSLATGVRPNPAAGEGKMYKSVIKPLKQAYKGLGLDPFAGKLAETEIQPANDEEKFETVKVMGGEDWEDWIKVLSDEGVLASNATTIAYSYLGPKLSWAIYKDGTIGAAKQDLERATQAINTSKKAKAYVAIMKAVVTRASSVIPIIPLYISVLFKVMKEKGGHEDCIMQLDRLFRDQLYVPSSNRTPSLDEAGRMRLDNLELDPAIQREVDVRMEKIAAVKDNPEQAAAVIAELADAEGFRNDFLRVHGFAVEGVDYEADLAPNYNPALGK